MGTTMSSLFLREAGDVVIAATRKFPNRAHRFARDIEGAAMRGAYVALVHASLAPLAWDPIAECVRLADGTWTASSSRDGADEPPQPLDEAELKKLARRVCHERLTYEQLWHARVVVGEKLKLLHLDCVRGIRRARRARRELKDAAEFLGVHDGHFVPLEGETLGTRWHDLLVAIGDRVPVQSHETLERVVAGAARLCCEEVLVRHADVFDVTAGVNAEIVHEQKAHDDRIALLTELLPHLEAQVRSQGCEVAAERVMREFEALVARVLRMENKKLKDADKQRPLSVQAPSEWRYMMSIVSIRIDGAAKIPKASDDGEDSEAAFASEASAASFATVAVAPFGGLLEPDIEVARSHLKTLLAEAFAAGPYGSRGDAYVAGLRSARMIAAAAVTACYKLYTEIERTGVVPPPPGKQAATPGA
jgi:hypothetical protein